MMTPSREAACPAETTGRSQVTPHFQTSQSPTQPSPLTVHRTAPFSFFLGGGVVLLDCFYFFIYFIVFYFFNMFIGV